MIMIHKDGEVTILDPIRYKGQYVFPGFYHQEDGRFLVDGLDKNGKPVIIAIPAKELVK